MVSLTVLSPRPAFFARRVPQPKRFAAREVLSGDHNPAPQTA
jgi:hypothetical protein